MDLESDKFLFSRIRTALYFDYMENEWLFKVNSGLLSSRSAVAAREDVDFKEVMPEIFKLRQALSSSMDYLNKESGGKSSVDLEREKQAKEYMEYVKRVLGEDKVKELVNNGKL